MILIPTWVLLLEITILEFILLFVYARNRHQTVGKIAGTIFWAFVYSFVMYAIVDYVPLAQARVLARYAFSLQFFTFILIFGRFAWLLRK
jgi:hypothetical protein